MGFITKTVRLSGSSQYSIEDAIASVLGRAANTLKDVQAFRVVELGGTVDESGVPAEYSVTLDVTFVVRESAAEHYCGAEAKPD